MYHFDLLFAFPWMSLNEFFKASFTIVQFPNAFSWTCRTVCNLGVKQTGLGTYVRVLALPQLWVGSISQMARQFLVPAWFGCFSTSLIPIYFTFFDIMNCIGHCNFEVVPRWLQAGPLKYFIYTSTYHSLHHSKYKYNYCLFCPIWDHIGGTVHSTTESLHEQVLTQKPRPLDAVFLAHGHGTHSMLSPFLATHQHEQRWWMIPLQPLTFLWVLFCRYCLSTACVQRYQYRGTQCATWSGTSAMELITRGEAPGPAGSVKLVRIANTDYLTEVRRLPAMLGDFVKKPDGFRHFKDLVGRQKPQGSGKAVDSTAGAHGGVTGRGGPSTVPTARQPDTVDALKCFRLQLNKSYMPLEYLTSPELEKVWRLEGILETSWHERKLFCLAKYQLASLIKVRSESMPALRSDRGVAIDLTAGPDTLPLLCGPQGEFGSDQGYGSPLLWAGKCLPVTGHFYFMKSHRQSISDMIVQAVKDADDAGVRYLGLAHLNKAHGFNHQTW
eukprot:s4487_g2.t1